MDYQNENGQQQFNNGNGVAQEQHLNPENQQRVNILLEGAEELPMELRQGIESKVLEIRQQTGEKRIFPVVVRGDEFDNKPWYIGYFKRPGIGAYSMFMNKVQSDSIQASQMLAQNCFIGGDKEMLEGDLFVFGTMNQLTALIENRHAVLVKVSSAGK